MLNCILMLAMSDCLGIIFYRTMQVYVFSLRNRILKTKKKKRLCDFSYVIRRCLGRFWLKTITTMSVNG
ncbi:hypothetical protein HanIR_Chr01g0039391 [Helianthus annuus]|nr:hypothetical protein HanIR_Chr01g0039391 [Helianthus annuus]